MAITKATNPVTGFNSATEEGLKLPSGTNANQPSGVQGMLRNDTEETVDSSASALTHYNGTAWQYFAATESPDVVYPTSLKMFLDASNTDSYPGTGTTWFDLTTNQNNGTISNTSWNLNGYFDFNGSSSIINLPDVATFDRYSEIKAVSAWVKLDTTTSRVFPLSISSTTNSNDYWYFGWLADLGAIYVATRDGSSSNQSFATAAVTANTNWRHIFCQVTATAREIYLDGVKQTVTYTKAGSGTDISWIDYPSYDTNAKGAIGVLRLASPNYSNGFISKIQAYDETLTQAEITALYNEGR